MKFLRRIVGKTRRDKWRKNYRNIRPRTNPELYRKKKYKVVWSCGKNARLQKTKNRLWRSEGRKEEVEEDQGGLGKTV
jgi:hypothetical protein